MKLAAGQTRGIVWGALRSRGASPGSLALDGLPDALYAPPAMSRLRRGLLPGHVLVSLLLLALAAGTCGSADVVSAHTMHGHDVQGAPSAAPSCVSMVPPAADGRLEVALEATLPAPVATPAMNARVLVAGSRSMPDAATDPPRFLLHSALLI